MIFMYQPSANQSDMTERPGTFLHEFLQVLRAELRA
jgi:hypothetical protein